jgi:asparagine synthase (glutamine-hydrolysing)
MCGIAGCIGLSKQITEDVTKQVIKMTEQLSHRGPDGSGFFSDNKVAFGHRLLSIMDLSPYSKQPMSDADDKIVIVFNGAIYNHNELRKELEPYYKFRSVHSDTEVIIYAYKKWGVDFVQKLSGMFAIAIYDKINHEIILLRDRLGKKPLYYLNNSGYLYFCSEIYPLFSSDIIQKKLNEKALYNYLTFLTTPAPDSFYENVFKLESGYMLKISQESIKKVKYWDIADFINQDNKTNFHDAKRITEELLERSMYYRNVADVPISVALSGGLDSSLDLYYSKKLNPTINTVNLAYTEKSKFDESNIAGKFSKDLNVPFRPLKISDQTINDTISEYLNIQMDMPAGDPNTILLYYISKMVHNEGGKVLMVGEGGDEIGGYPVYLKLHDEYLRLRRIRPILQDILKALPLKYARKWDCFYQGKIISRRHIHGFYEIEKNQFWNGEKDLNSYIYLKDLMAEIRDDLPDSFLRKILNIEYKLRLPELILARIDYPTMASSIEARSPFMDHKLIEFSSSLDFEVKMANGAKSILKSLAKEKLPDYILTHPKVGFGMLLTPFFRNTLPEWYRREIIEKDAPVHKYISKKFITKLYNQNKVVYLGSRLWVIYSLNKWLSFIESKSTS